MPEEQEVEKIEIATDWTQMYMLGTASQRPELVEKAAKMLEADPMHDQNLVVVIEDVATLLTQKEKDREKMRTIQARYDSMMQQIQKIVNKHWSEFIDFTEEI